MGREEFCWRRVLVAFGIPTVLIADDPDLLATASAAYPDWMADKPATEPEIEIRLETESAPSNRVSCGIDVKGSRLTLAGLDFEAHANALTKTAICTLPRRFIGHPGALAAEITDTVLLFLLARSGRIPVHAAGIAIEGKALVMMGPSGSGKSTLALAAARRGLRVYSDDTLFVQVEPSLRIWALPRPIHVFPEDAPGIGHSTRLRGGKRKAIIPMTDGQLGAQPAEAVITVLLQRGKRLALTKLSAEEVRTAMPPLEPGFDLLPVESAMAVDALMTGGAWRLTLGRDPDAAIDCLLGQFSGNCPDDKVLPSARFRR